MTCPCGSTYCGKRNESYFFRRNRWMRRKVRAVVFVWPGRGFWTWCPVIDDVPQDEGQAMGHYDDLETAFADADAWARGDLGSERPS